MIPTWSADHRSALQDFTTGERSTMALLTFTRTRGGAPVFDLHRSLDAAHAEKLDAKGTEALDAGNKRLIFDLTKTTFVASAGLTVFLKAYRRLQGEGQGAVRFAGLSDDVKNIFNITGLTARFEIYPTVEDALVG